MLASSYISYLHDYDLHYPGLTVTYVVLGELTCRFESVTVSENDNPDCAGTFVGTKLELQYLL